MIVTFDSVTEDEICFANSNITTFVGIEYEAILDDCIIIDGAGACESGYVDDCFCGSTIITGNVDPLKLKNK